MRIFGMSVWKCLKEYTTYGQGNLHDLEDVWYRIHGYAMHDFGRFVEDVIDDALEEHLRIRVRVLVRVPEGIQFPNPCYLAAHSEPDSVGPNFPQTIPIRVWAENNAFSEFVYNVPVPSIDIFDSPGSLSDWVTRITRYALDHIIPAGRPMAFRAFSRDLGRAESFAEYLQRSVSRGWPDTLPENKKAKALLLSHCTNEQIEQYKRNNWLIVIGGETGARYRIRRASQINIDVMNGDKVEYKLCTVNDPDCKVPIEDQLLAQKTMIELNELGFLEIAKRW